MSSNKHFCKQTFFQQKIKSEMKVFLKNSVLEKIWEWNESVLVCIHWMYTMRKWGWFHSINWPSNLCKFFCTFVLYWARDVLCATFSGFCFKAYYDLAFLQHPQPQGQNVATEVTAFSAKKIACITFASGLNSKIWAMKRRTRREHNLRYSREVCLPRV